MGQFSDSGIEAAGRGWGAVGGMQKELDESRVRPRELEAATSLAESRATVAKTQISTMQRLAFADEAATKAVTEANASGDMLQSYKIRMEKYNELGHFDEAVKMQKEKALHEQNTSTSITKAIEAKQKQNDLLSTTIRSLNSYEAANTFNDNIMKSAFEKSKTNPTPENRQEAAQAVAMQRILAEEKAKGTSWEDTYNKHILPNADALSTQAQNTKQILAENKRLADLAQVQIQKNHDATRIRVAEIAAAAARNRTGENKKLAFSVAAAKLENDYIRITNNIQKDIDKLTLESPEAKIPGSGIGGSTFFEDKGENPLITKKKELLDKLKGKYDKNLIKLQESVDKDKLFVPDPMEVKESEVTVSKQDKIKTLAGKDYDPAKYDYRIDDTGKLQRKPKG